MKKIIAYILSSSVVILTLAGCQTSQKQNSSQTTPIFKAGETVTLVDGIKLYAESVTSTNLQNVIVYECNGNDQMKPTAKAESADYSISDEEGVQLTLYNATIETEDEEGQPTTITAKSFPLVLNKK